MKAATYCRVSTDEQAQHGTSIASQRQSTRAYVDDRGWTFVAEYVDEGVSGAAEERPARREPQPRSRRGADSNAEAEA